MSFGRMVLMEGLGDTRSLGRDLRMDVAGAEPVADLFVNHVVSNPGRP